MIGIILLRERHRLLGAIDRRFFREQYQAEHIVANLAVRVRGMTGVAEVADGYNTGGLVSPTGCITVDNTTDPETYTVAIAWRGVTAATNPTANDCGSDTALYGASNEFRRVVFVTFYPGG